MTIQTKRCTVRPFVAADIGDFMAYRNNGEWMRHQGYKNQTRETYERDLLAPPDLAKGAQLAVADGETGRCIGDVYLKREADALWLGYTIAPGMARRGYAHEVASAVIRWAREHGYTAIKAGVEPDNTPSIGLLEKLGFEYVGVEDGERVYVLGVG